MYPTVLKRVQLFVKTFYTWISLIFPKTSTEETIRFVSYFIAEFQFIVYQLRLKKKRNNS